MEILTPEEETRVELVCYIWKKLNDYLIDTLPKITQNIGTDLEERMTSWIMNYRQIKKTNILCLRTGDTPVIGISGLKYKIDNLMYVREKDYTHGYLVECKNLEIESLKNFLTQGDFPRVGRKTIALMILESLEVCPSLLFKRIFYTYTDRNFCMLVTTKPLDYSALILALSYGVCVIQPDLVSYQKLIKNVDSTIVMIDEIVRKIPVYYPPEVLLKGLSASKKASKGNKLLTFKIYKHLFSKSLESISSNFSKMIKTFHEERAKNVDIVDKIIYLSMYFNSLNEDFSHGVHRF